MADGEKDTSIIASLYEKAHTLTSGRKTSLLQDRFPRRILRYIPLLLPLALKA